jgi:hypothetical protein
VKNYYNADVLKKQMAKEAEIAALWQWDNILKIKIVIPN